MTNVPEGLKSDVKLVERIIKDDDELLNEFRKLTLELKKHGGDRSKKKPSEQVDIINLNSPSKGGTSADYLFSRLKRDAPGMLDEIGKGKRFKSVRAAAVEAGQRYS